MVPLSRQDSLGAIIWIVNDVLEVVSAPVSGKELQNYRVKRIRHPEAKKSGLKVVTLIATLNPVSQVLW